MSNELSARRRNEWFRNFSIMHPVKGYQHVEYLQRRMYDFTVSRGTALSNFILTSWACRTEWYQITFWQCANRLERTAWHDLQVSWLITWLVSAAKTVESFREKYKSYQLHMQPTTQHPHLPVLIPRKVNSFRGQSSAVCSASSHLHVFSDKAGNDWTWLW